MRNLSRSYYLWYLRLSYIKKINLLLFLLPLLLFLINEEIKYRVDVPYMGYLLKCHFNDFLGGISFAAYTNLILLFSRWTSFYLYKLQHFIFLGAICSFAWEWMVPIIKENSTSDWFDVLSYMLGMLSYFFLMKYFIYVKNRNEIKIV